jgi:RNA polymerase sigma factor (sigma-70 family)
MDEALEKFAVAYPQKAELVRLRYYTDCTLAEAAELLGISVSTAKRHWSYARAWLYSELCGVSSE